MKGENEQFYALEKFAKKETDMRKKKMILKDMSLLKAQAEKLAHKKKEEQIIKHMKKLWREKRV